MAVTFHSAIHFFVMYHFVLLPRSSSWSSLLIHTLSFPIALNWRTFKGAELYTLSFCLELQREGTIYEAFSVKGATKPIKVIFFCFWKHLAGVEFLLHHVVEQVKEKSGLRWLVGLEFRDYSVYNLVKLGWRGECRNWKSLYNTICSKL